MVACRNADGFKYGDIKSASLIPYLRSEQWKQPTYEGEQVALIGVFKAGDVTNNRRELMGRAPLPPLLVVGATVAEGGALLPRRQGDIQLPNFTAWIQLKNKEEALCLYFDRTRFTPPHKLVMTLLHRRFQPLGEVCSRLREGADQGMNATAAAGTAAGGTDEQSMDIGPGETATPQVMENAWRVQQNRHRGRNGGNNSGRRGYHGGT